MIDRLALDLRDHETTQFWARVDNPFLLSAVLQGGFGTVLLVKQHSDGKLYALKEISKRAIQSNAHGEHVLAESEAAQNTKRHLVYCDCCITDTDADMHNVSKSLLRTGVRPRASPTKIPFARHQISQIVHACLPPGAARVASPFNHLAVRRVPRCRTRLFLDGVRRYALCTYCPSKCAVTVNLHRRNSMIRSPRVACKTRI
eukprot:6201998-Pleurochrysis_carterae.AAC.1